MTTFIGIAGGSGSGKSTFCESLRDKLGISNCAIISYDSYYRPNDCTSKKDRDGFNYDHPSALDTGLLCSHLESLRSGKSVQVPVYCFEKHVRLERTDEVHPKAVLVVEGILLFSEESVRSLFHHLIFVEASNTTRFQRRMNRDMRERGRSRESVIGQWQESVLPMHEKHVEPTKQWADVIISTESHPIDAEEVLRKIGIAL